MKDTPTSRTEILRVQQGAVATTGTQIRARRHSTFFASKLPPCVPRHLEPNEEETSQQDQAGGKVAVLPLGFKGNSGQWQGKNHLETVFSGMNKLYDLCAMDEYTRQTRAWLEEIYAGPPPGFGPYVPHSPIHGLSLRAQYLGTYVHLYAVLRQLSKYEFSSVLDVGAGEGFLTRVIEDIFGAHCVAVDLSLQACRRARERVRDVVSADATQLPFQAKAIDVVVSVNTLEHIRPIQEAVSELRRVARNLLVVALPHTRTGTERELPVTPHAHVSMLTRAEMHLLFGPRARIYPSLSRIVRPLYAFLAEDDIREQPRYRWLARPPWNAMYTLARAVGRALPRRTMLRWLCQVEYVFAQLLPWWTYESIVVVELEQARPRKPRVSSRRLLEVLLRSPKSDCATAR